MTSLVLVTAFGVCVLASAPALAAAPEAPETGAAEPTATAVVLHGVLNPNAAGQPGSYQFSYDASATECAPGTLDPTSPELAMGVEKEAKSVTLTGLEPNKEYAFCIIAYSLSAEPSRGVAVPFKTLAAKPTLVSETASVISTSATLEAQIDPNNESTTYAFEYSAKGKIGTGEKLEGTVTKSDGASPLSGYGDQTATIPEVSGLAPGTSYFYRVVGTNATGTTTGSVEEFATVATPHTEAVSVPTARTATFHGTLAPLNSKVSSEYSFRYAVGATCAGGSSTPPVSVGTGSGSIAVSETVTGLQPSATYSVCLVSSNVFGSEVDPASPPVHFTTSAAAPAVESETSSVLGSEEATLEAVVNPDNQETTCKFEYGGESVLKIGTTTTVACREALGSGGGGVNASVTLAGLTPATTYYYRIVATNATGPKMGFTESFETQAASAPVVKRESASTVETAAATLEAEIAPENAATRYYFAYGTGEAGETRTTEARLPANGNAEARITGLVSNTTYRYRVVAISKLAPSGVIGPVQTLTTREGPIATAETCPNAQRRAEQSFALGLPDCRAYEMVSPVDTEGENATEEDYTRESRAAEEGAVGEPTSEAKPEDEGGAVTYQAAGAFAEPTGAAAENQFVSRREPAEDRWATLAITPLHEPDQAETSGSYGQDVFNPELTEGIASTNAPLTPEAPKTESSGGGRELGLYVANFANRSYRYVTTERDATIAGASADLSHVVFGEYAEKLYESSGATSVSVGVDNNDEGVPANIAGWHSVSEDGSRVVFTRDGQIYVRLNADQPHQSPLVEPEVEGSGTVTQGSKAVTELVVASGLQREPAERGSPELEVTPVDGKFFVGQPLAGSGFEAGTTITAVTQGAQPFTERLTLSKPLIASVEATSVVSSDGPAPFVVGQGISGAGIAAGTTVTGVADGSLTLSKAAASSESKEQLNAGGGCTFSTDACTVEASASRREAENPAGQQPARYWGASADGSKVFLTSKAELTEDAYTGLAGEGANLYQYEPATNTLTDLTAADKTGAGADVQGVAQVSEDGSYVYFVAKSVLTGEHGEALRNASGAEPVAEGDNLYVSHENGTPTFVVTLGSDDGEVWDTSPETNTASVSANGRWLAFLSRANLTGYDNEQAHEHEDECEGKTGFANKGETGQCLEAYLYNSESGRLVCASCNPTGARPVGPANLSEPREGLYRPRVVTNEGTLFFASYDKLVPGASGLQNVYEYEDGQVRALSDVSGGYESFLLDASASGGDVFFATADQLLPQAKSNNIVVYDARIDGGFPMPPVAPSCDSGDSCKPPPSAQPSVFMPNGSATFNGLGNASATSAVASTPRKKTVAQVKAEDLAKALKSCRKDKEKSRRQRCEKQARAKYGPARKKAKAKKSSNERRTQS